jgi:uncharacterized DUF497 family protein
MWDGDEAKRQANRAKHGVDFAQIDGFDWATAVTREDTRGDYGERRFISTGLIGDRVHVCIWTIRAGRMRLISLRKANARERAQHGRAEKLH